ncbi:hypothetical protein [Micromonospora sp. NPDC003776]
MIAALTELRDAGCPVVSPDHVEQMADIGLRRWHSFARRHRPRGPASLDARVRDLVRGLVDACEPEPSLTGPLTRDYECVAWAVARAVTVDGEERDGTSQTAQL